MALRRNYISIEQIHLPYCISMSFAKYVQSLGTIINLVSNSISHPFTHLKLNSSLIFSIAHNSHPGILVKEKSTSDLSRKFINTNHLKYILNLDIN